MVHFSLNLTLPSYIFAIKTKKQFSLGCYLNLRLCLCPGFVHPPEVMSRPFLSVFLVYHNAVPGYDPFSKGQGESKVLLIYPFAKIVGDMSTGDLKQHCFNIYMNVQNNSEKLYNCSKIEQGSNKE